MTPVSTKRRIRAKRLAWLPTFLALLALAALNGPSRGQAPAREQQIAEIQKQIDELNKKLEALKKAGEPKAEAKAETLALGPEWVKSLTWRSIGPANMGGRIVALSVFEADPTHLLGRHRRRRPAQDDQQRHHLRAPVRQGSDRLDRRRVRRPVEQEHRLGRHRREQPAELRLLRRRRLQVDRRRQDLEEHGAQEDVPDRQDPDPSQEPGHRLRRRARPALRAERGARPVQDDRRRQDLERRSSTSTTRPASSTCGCIRPTPRRCSSPPTSASATFTTPSDPIKKCGPGARPLQDDRRRQDLQEARRRACPTVQPRPHRPRLLPQGPEHRLRDHRVARRSAPGRRPQGRVEQRLPRHRRRRPRGRGRDDRPGRRPAAPATRPGSRRATSSRPVGDKDDQDLRRASTSSIRDKKAGDKVKVKVERGGKPVDVELTLEADAPLAGRAAGTAGRRPSGGERPRLGLDPDRPFGAAFGGQTRERPGPPGRRRLPDRRRLQVDRRRRVLDADQQPQPPADVLQPGPRRSERRQVSLRARRLAVPLDRRRQDVPRRRRPRRPRRPARPVDRPERRPAHDPRLRRRLLRHLRPRRTTGTTSTTWPSASSITSRSTPRRHYRVYGGLQDNGSWGGPSRTPVGGAGPINEDWISRRRRRRLRLPGRSERPRPRLLDQPGRRHGPPQPPHAARPPRSGPGRRDGARPLPLQLEHAVHPVASQLEDLLRRGQLRLPLARTSGDDLRAISPEITRTRRGQRHRARRVAAQPRRALCRHRRRRALGDARTAARTGRTSPRTSA